jgi:SAM-dependent methyltransferase
MDKDYEQAYARIEEEHPWFVTRRELFGGMVAGRQSQRLLDVGCGTGMFLRHLEQQGFEHLCGVEASPELRAAFRVPTIPLHPEIPAQSFDALFMLDVLEHIEDDEGFLTCVQAALAPGGSYYLSVPAHPFLWSRHDELNHHFRRYRKGELRRKLSAAGFRIRSLSYWNMTGFLPALLLRTLGLGGRGNELDLGNPLAMSVYRACLRLENRLVRSVGLPFGVSLIAVCDKDAD